MTHANVLDQIGNTPLVAVTRLGQWPGVKVLAKLECMNPGGSIKDRVARAMIEAAELNGELTPDKTVIEATSGNTGIGLAMVCAVKGYKLRLLMSEAASEERKRILAAYGAEIQLTPGHLSTDGAIEEAYRMAREEPDKYVLVDQYNNQASVQAHYMGTGLEIWEQTNGEVTHVICTLGTSGTAMGITKRMREMSEKTDHHVEVVAVEPYAGHKIQGLKNMQESYPPGIYDKKFIHTITHVEDEIAFDMCRRMAREEGLFSGMSSGAAMAAALRLAEQMHAEGREATIVVVLPDAGDRYLSTPLFASTAGGGPCVRDEATGKDVCIEPGAVTAGMFALGPALDSLYDADAWRRIALLDVLARSLAKDDAPKDAPPAARVLVGMADMDDRAMEAARAANMSRDDFSSNALAELAVIARRLGVSSAVEFAAASASQDTVLGVCRKLLAKGQAYEKLRSVYFDVLRFERYGNVSHMDMDKLSLGKTVDLADYIKDNPKDFTLLKRASLADLKSGECMTTEWGNVRPSWFLQLAATAMDGLDNVTLFMGSQPHRFPHMENFRAIWSLAGGLEPKAWLLTQPLTGSGAEDEGAPDFAALLQALIAGDDAAGPIRMWLLSTAYRKHLTLSEENLGMWRKNWQRVQNLAAALAEIAGNGEQATLHPDVEQALVDLKTGLKSALENDLSLHRFWPVLFTFCRDAQQRLGSGAMTGAEATACLRRLRNVDKVLGILDESRLPVAAALVPPEVTQLAAERQKARAAKDFARADALREKILNAGYRIEDTARGERYYPAS